MKLIISANSQPQTEQEQCFHSETVGTPTSTISSRSDKKRIFKIIKRGQRDNGIFRPHAKEFNPVVKRATFRENGLLQTQYNRTINSGNQETPLNLTHQQAEPSNLPLFKVERPGKICRVSAKNERSSAHRVQRHGTRKHETPRISSAPLTMYQQRLYEHILDEFKQKVIASGRSFEQLLRIHTPVFRVVKTRTSPEEM